MFEVLSRLFLPFDTHKQPDGVVRTLHFADEKLRFREIVTYQGHAGSHSDVSDGVGSLKAPCSLTYGDSLNFQEARRWDTCFPWTGDLT